MSKGCGGGSVKRIQVPSKWFQETRKKLEEEANKPKMGNPPEPEKEALIREFYGRVSGRQLAQMLGLAEGCVRYWVRRWGISAIDNKEKAK